jgi:hypothetical protein
MILPRAPALANTPRFTSGRAKDALLLAITMSLPLGCPAAHLPIHHHLKPSSYVLTQLKFEIPNANPLTAAMIGLSPFRLETPQNPSVKSIPGGESRFLFLRH